MPATAEPTTGRWVRRRLRWFPLWRAVGWGLVAVVVYASLMPAPPLPGFSAADKVAHVAGYAGLMLWFVQLYQRPAYGRVALALVTLGVGLEVAQGLTGYRSFDYWDMAANGLGVVVAWGLGLTPVAMVLQTLERKMTA